MSTVKVNAITDASGGNTATINSMTPTAGSLQGFRNRFINAGMQIAQRATSATITAGGTIAAGYATVDRWYCYSTGGNVTMAQVSGTGNNRNNLQITGGASVTAVGVGQRIESLNSYDLAGQTCTLSVNLSNSLLTTVTWTAFYANTTDTFGTLASPTRTQIATGTFTVTSTLTTYTTNISIPAAATTGVEIVFTVGAQTSGTWVIGTAQLEVGSTATPFERRPYGTELALCQRYCEVLTGVNNTRFALSGQGEGTNIFPAYFTKQVMRAAPSVSVSAAGDFKVVLFNNSGYVATAIGADNLTINGGTILVTTGSTLTGNGGFLAGNNSNARLTLNAEL